MSALIRRRFLKNSVATALSAALPGIAFAQTIPPARSHFAPQSGTWRTFEVTTQVDIATTDGLASGTTRVWLPVPSVNGSYQRLLENIFSSNGSATLLQDTQEGVKMLYAEFPASQARPSIVLTSRVQTQNRAIDWSRKTATSDDADTLRHFTRDTAMIPTDGIVRETAVAAVQGATTDVDKARRLYDWIVTNTYREPTVRGCGEGDIKAMLETGNLGGKCADLNALFVGLCRSVGLPARDVYGIRLVPSAFGYNELSGNPSSLKSAQHCRAEVHLNGYGWVAMDPADVAKVMRLETADWIKNTTDPVVAPVNQALFGGWEGNWMAYNTAHDLALPNSTGDKLAFFMYPTAETAAGRVDPYAPDDFKYQITAREIKA